MLYVKLESVKEGRAKVIDKLRDMMEQEKVMGIADVVEIASALYDITDMDGLVGDAEIFRNVRDRIEERREMI